MGKLTIVGLGPGNGQHLSLETLALLESGAEIILRTAVHPAVELLAERDIPFTSCDDLYEQGEDFESVYQAVAARVLAAAAEGDVIYAVPGSPLVAERTVALLREAAAEQGIEFELKPAMSFLDLAYAALALDPLSGLRIADAEDETAIRAAGQYPLLFTQVYNRFVASDLKLALMQLLDDETEVILLWHLGLPEAVCRPLKLYELDRQKEIDHLTSVYLAGGLKRKTGETAAAASRAIAAADEAFDAFDIQPLTDVMRILREPGGCPWDREQTFQSIRSNFIEEVYEFLEAVDDGDVAGMREELGDVLMQVVFHARMAQEAGLFDLQEVIDEVTDKLIRRHPHVFADTEAETSAEVLVNWEAIKLEEKTQRKRALDGVTRILPALLRAYKLQGKAAKAGFDWPDAASVLAKVTEEAGELKQALADEGQTAAERELGDLLFALVNYARHLGIEPETALNGCNNRFLRRFNYVEDQVELSGKSWQDYTLAELDAFWEEAKAQKL